MSSPLRSGEFQNGIDILGTEVDPETGTVLSQTGDAPNKQTDSDGVKMLFPPGFIARPPAPTPDGKACQALVRRCGDRDVAIGYFDVRAQKLAGNLAPGETCLYAGGTDGKGQARLLLKANGAAALYTAEGNTQGGNSIAIQVNTDGSISLSCGGGAITIGNDGIKIVEKGGAGIMLSGGNITLIGTGIALNGGSVSLGANATMPVLWGPTGIAGAASLSVKVAI